MQMFTRLLMTRMVASNRSTSPSRRSTAAAEALRLLLSRLTSLCEREKNEVSAPDTSAETHNRQRVTAHNTARRGSKPLKTIHEAVSSKLQSIG